MAVAAAQGWTSLSPAQVQQLYDSGGPAASPPPGVVPNFTDPATLYGWTCVAFATGLVFSTSAVVVRLFTRWKLMKSVVVEDFIIAFAWISQFGQLVPNLLALRSGMGRHMWDITLVNFIHGSIYVPPSCLPYGVTMMLTKVAILLQYLRVFVPVRQMNLPLYIACWVCLATTVLFYSTTTINDGYHIGKLYGKATPLVMQKFFQRSNKTFNATGYFNVVSDTVILLLPLPTILRLRIPTRKKCVVMGLFFAGLLACVAAAMRLYYTWRMFNTVDSSWNYCVMTLCTWAEFSIGIVVFCFPIMPTFFRFFKAKWYAPLTSRIKSVSQSSWTSTWTDSDDDFLKKVDVKTPEVVPVNSTSTLFLQHSHTLSSHSDVRMLEPVLYPDEVGIYHFRPRAADDNSDRV